MRQTWGTGIVSKEAYHPAAPLGRAVAWYDQQEGPRMLLCIAQDSLQRGCSSCGWHGRHDNSTWGMRSLWQCPLRQERKTRQAQHHSPKAANRTPAGQPTRRIASAARPPRAGASLSSKLAGSGSAEHPSAAGSLPVASCGRSTSRVEARAAAEASRRSVLLFMLRLGRESGGRGGGASWRRLLGAG